MKISLNIERIVIDGSALTGRERAQLTGDVEHELARLLGERQLDGDRPAQVATRTPAPDAPATLGTRIARGLLAALPPGTFGPPARPSRPTRARRGPVLPGGPR